MVILSVVLEILGVFIPSDTIKVSEKAKICIFLGDRQRIKSNYFIISNDLNQLLIFFNFPQDLWCFEITLVLEFNYCATVTHWLKRRPHQRHRIWKDNYSSSIFAIYGIKQRNIIRNIFHFMITSQLTAALLNFVASEFIINLIPPHSSKLNFLFMVL